MKICISMFLVLILGLVCGCSNSIDIYTIRGPDERLTLPSNLDYSRTDIISTNGYTAVMIYFIPHVKR